MKAVKELGFVEKIITQSEQQNRCKRRDFGDDADDRRRQTK